MAKAKNEKPKKGRPFSWGDSEYKILERLCKMQMPYEDILEALGVSTLSALDKRCVRHYGRTFADLYQELSTLPKKKGGKRKIEWDEERFALFETCCRCQCTQSEICSNMKIDRETLNRLCVEHYGESLPDTYKRFAESGLVSLRRAQWTSALKGNTSMQIWLGKQLLGQKDNVEVSADDDTLVKARELLDGISSVIK